MNAYRRNLDEVKYMSFLIKDNKLLEKYNKMQKKKSAIASRIDLMVK